MVYRALAQRLGLISNDQLRRQIIQTYALAHGLTMSFEMNNELVRNLREIQAMFARGNSSRTIDDLREANQKLSIYGDGLRRSYAELVASVEALLKMLPK